MELTDSERLLLGGFVSWVGRALIDARAAGDLVSKIRFVACFTSSRSNVPLHRALIDGARGHGRRTTTVKMAESQAQWWLSTIPDFIEFDDVPAPIRIEVFKLCVPLARALAAKRGKRPKLPDKEVAALVRKLETKPDTASPINRAAFLLRKDPSTVARALRRRKKSAGSAAAILLSE